MTEETFSDEILMRFADGELDPETVARIEQAMEIDDRLVTRVAMFIETRAQAQAALKPLLDEPVPEKLVAAVEQMVEAKRASEKAASVLPFGGGRMAGPPSRFQWLLPIA
ncbi:anti-sigma factor, partial [Mesorhizobium sp. M6A.T.Cr.TU.017.01.1.1]